jgi:hypothetical protein
VSRRRGAPSSPHTHAATHPSSLARGAQALNLVGAPVVADTFGKPEIAIGASRDALWKSFGGRDGELRNVPSCRDAPDLVGIALGKPEIAIGSRRDLSWYTAGVGKRKSGNIPSGADAPDSAAAKLPSGKPEIAIGASRDALWKAARWKAKFGHDPRGADAPDIVAALVAAATFGKPEIAIGASRDAPCHASAEPGGDGEYLHIPARRDAPDSVGIRLRKPEIAIGSRRDLSWVTAVAGKRKFGDSPPRRDALDLVPRDLGKPEIAIGARRDAPWIVAVDGKLKFGESPVSGDAPDLAVVVLLGKPEVAIGARRDALWTAANWKGKCGKWPTWSTRNKKPGEATGEDQNHDPCDDRESEKPPPASRLGVWCPLLRRPFFLMWLFIRHAQHLSYQLCILMKKHENAFGYLSLPCLRPRNRTILLRFNTLSAVNLWKGSARATPPLLRLKYSFSSFTRHCHRENEPLSRSLVAIHGHRHSLMRQYTCLAATTRAR